MVIVYICNKGNDVLRMNIIRTVAPLH